MDKWRALIVLALAQFLMVLDQAVMNVSISQLVDDFDTSVTTIQGVITFYSLTMAMLMMTGGKLGDILGRRRAFTIGLVIYAAGSALTAVSWNVTSLLIGWSILEGIGAALVLPALLTLITSNYQGASRVTAFGVIGGVAGVGIAAGPIVGGYFTANLSWRYVFVGEVLIAVVILLLVRWITDAPRGRTPRLDVVGSVLAAVGLGMVVVGALQSSTWGWIDPKSSPVEPFGFALTPFVIAGGFAVMWVFVVWQGCRVRRGLDPLVNVELFRLPSLPSGLGCYLAQNTILLGIFFTLPLYFQIVLGFDALETGLRMLPISIAMFLTSASGSALVRLFSPRRIVQGGFVALAIAAFLLLNEIEPDLDNVGVALSLVLLGIGMGLIASQLGNVVQSAVTPADRGEAGGLQYTSQQLGAALGSALIGAVVIGSLVAAFVKNIEADEVIPRELTAAISIEMGSGASFVPAAAVTQALDEAGIDPVVAGRVVEDYEDAQLRALKTGLLVAALIALAALLVTRGLPARRLEDDEDDDGDDGDEDATEASLQFEDAPPSRAHEDPGP